jgi:hypothetical protein
VRSDRVEAIAVVVPAHDEEQLLDDALTSIRAAVDAVAGRGLRVSIHLVLDDCTDRSAELARAHAADDLEVRAIDARCVGAARAAGVAAALARHSETPLHTLWTAHTDADSVVPAHWLSHQLDLARAGADIVVGTVRPDFRDLTPEQVAAWCATHTPGVANGHVHGANLGMRASVLTAAGGYEPVCEHEDVSLVERAIAAGGRVAASDLAWVRTSGRSVGRTAGGYAGYLREQLIPLARSAGERMGA